MGHAFYVMSIVLGPDGSLKLPTTEIPRGTYHHYPETGERSPVFLRGTCLGDRNVIRSTQATRTIDLNRRD